MVGCACFGSSEAYVVRRYTVGYGGRVIVVPEAVSQSRTRKQDLGISCDVLPAI